LEPRDEGVLGLLELVGISLYLLKMFWGGWLEGRVEAGIDVVDIIDSMRTNRIAHFAAVTASS